MTWTCPYCTQNATIISSNQSIKEHDFDNNNISGTMRLRSVVIVCPNSECKQYTINSFLYKTEYVNNVGRVESGGPIAKWALRPLSSAKPYPDYIPAPILQDYDEACLIRDLSPKASATLSRRCLQGMIRDYWGISKNRLVDEIAAIKDKVDPTTWAAIDAVRKVGNIGAHMEKDINIIVDVEPNEAQLLITLIEILFKDWYISRYERQSQLEAIIGIATKIEDVKK